MSIRIYIVSERGGSDRLVAQSELYCGGLITLQGINYGRKIA